jgi:thiaminase (transcriptional activator TenA)
MEAFSEIASRQTQTLRAAIRRLPFNTELAAGSLARERFQHYITQDAIYLGQFSRALALAAAKAPNAATLEAFTQSALRAAAVERVLHEDYLRAVGMDPGMLERTEPAPDCLAYTSFLIAAAYHEPWEVLVAALLPCFTIYWEVGGSISAAATAANPYRAWIDTYADPRFGEAVRETAAIVDRAAEKASEPVRARMLAAFIRAAQYEWLFWDGAYQRRGWPPAG